MAQRISRAKRRIAEVRLDEPGDDRLEGTVEALRIKQKAAESSYCDFGIHGLLGDESIDQLEALLEAGVTSFKAFVGNTFGNCTSGPGTGPRSPWGVAR